MFKNRRRFRKKGEGSATNSGSGNSGNANASAYHYSYTHSGGGGYSHIVTSDSHNNTANNTSSSNNSSSAGNKLLRLSRNLYPTKKNRRGSNASSISAGSHGNTHGNANTNSHTQGNTNTNNSNSQAAHRLWNHDGILGFGSNKNDGENGEEDHHHHLLMMNTSSRMNALSNFDACIAACDSLAANANANAASGISGSNNGGEGDNLPDCSVLVSPDGILLDANAYKYIYAKEKKKDNKNATSNTNNKQSENRQEKRTDADTDADAANSGTGNATESMEGRGESGSIGGSDQSEKEKEQTGLDPASTPTLTPQLEEGASKAESDTVTVETSENPTTDDNAATNTTKDVFQFSLLQDDKENNASNDDDDDHNARANATDEDGTKDETNGDTELKLESEPEPEPEPAAQETSVQNPQHHAQHQHQHQHQHQYHYQSAIYVGNDTVEDGERVLNGFTARGWNPIMASLAMKKSVHTLQSTASFVEELILSRKNSAATASQACEQLRDMMMMEGMSRDGMSMSMSGNGSVGGGSSIHENEMEELDALAMPTATGTATNTVAVTPLKSIPSADGSASASTPTDASVSPSGTESRGGSLEIDTSHSPSATTIPEDQMSPMPAVSVSASASGSPSASASAPASNSLDDANSNPQLQSSSTDQPPPPPPPSKKYSIAASPGMTPKYHPSKKGGSMSHSPHHPHSSPHYQQYSHLHTPSPSQHSHSHSHSHGGKQRVTLTPMQKSSAGPLLFPDGTLYHAMVALERYHSEISQRDAVRWRMASEKMMSSVAEQNDGSGSMGSGMGLGMGGVLHEIQHEAEQTQLRCERRDRALNLSHQAAAEAESNLRLKKDQSRKLWSKVDEMEEHIRTKIEEMVRERSRVREQKRRQEELERRNFLANSSAALESTVTNQEIWELVASVGSIGDDFAPSGLPTPNFDGPIDQSLSSPSSRSFDMKDGTSSSFGGIGGGGSSDANQDSMVQPSPSSQQPSTSTSQGMSTMMMMTPTTSSSVQSPQVLAEIDEYRATLEAELGLDHLRQAAVESDDQVQDAAGSLLNILSASDTTRRSARVAAEATLLSSAQAQLSCLQSLVKLERESMEERMRLLERLEQAVNAVDVRRDLNDFVQHEKEYLPNGGTKHGDVDDGGIASALAVLNSHSEGIGVGIGVAGMAELSSFTSWNESENHSEDQQRIYDREELEEAVSLLFESDDRYYDDQDDDGNGSGPGSARGTPDEELKEAVDFLVAAVGEKSVRARGYRASTCYAMNNHRGKVTQLSRRQFDGLCEVFNALLGGCDRESADVASVKMVMMLCQTFYTLQEEKEGPSGSSTSTKTNHVSDRTKRIYPKSRVCHHPIWQDEDFWVQALFQCVTDSLSHSGVMVRVRVRKSAALKNKNHGGGSKMKWHDLRPADRADAAAQVHAVIFAQLGALAHSMVEFGCSVDMACAFVRRLSVRHQLPLSQRTMLLSHLRRSQNENEDGSDSESEED